MPEAPAMMQRLAVAFTCASLAVLAALSACNGQVATPSEVVDRFNPMGPDPGENRVAPSPGASPSGPFIPQSGALLVTIGHPPDALATDADHVYWNELGSVFRVTKPGAAREKLFGDGTGSTPAIVVDDAFVYAVDGQAGSVRAWAKSDGAVSVLIPEGSGATSLALDEANLYVGMASPGGAGVAVVSKASHAITSMLRAGQSVMKVALFATTVFTVERGSGADGSFDIVRSTTDGAAASVELGTSASAVDTLAVFGNDVYWLDDHGHLVSSLNAAPLLTPAAGSHFAAGLVVKDVYAYVTQTSDDDTAKTAQLLRLPLSSGPAQLLATLGIDSPLAISRGYGRRLILDGNFVYVTASWSDATGAQHTDAILEIEDTPSRPTP
jgi:hypothetical protein